MFYQLEKLSREWPGLNNITWDENGALLADVTFGGFVIITLGLLIGQLCGELRRARRMVSWGGRNGRRVGEGAPDGELGRVQRTVSWGGRDGR